MVHYQLKRLLPDASVILCKILDKNNGPVEPPIRSELFGSERFTQHAHSLAETHHATISSNNSNTFFPRIKENILVLRQAHRYVGEQVSTGYDISPAAEWLLDNFHLIESQLKEIKEGLPSSYFRGLPVLINEPLAGLPRVYGIAWAFVAHSDGAFNEDLLSNFLIGYQQERELNLSEIWALPTTLRVVLVENLRRLAQRIATNKAAREVANLCCDNIENYSLSALDELLALLNERGVGSMFLAQMAQRLQVNNNQLSIGYIDWIKNSMPDLSAVQMQLPADQAADNLSMRNAITALRSIGESDWTDIVARTSELMKLMLKSPVFLAEDTFTRDESLHEIEQLAKRSNLTERTVARSLLEKIKTSLNDQDISGVPGYWLSNAGRQELMGDLGIRDRITDTWRRAFKRFSVQGYLITLLLATLCITAWIFLSNSNRQNDFNGFSWLAILGAIAIMFPASETALAVLNRLIGESIKPAHMPRLSFANGIPNEHRVIVVIPAMLTNTDTIKKLVYCLQLHYLANREECAQFAILTDWVDADKVSIDSDDALLSIAINEINKLNTSYPQTIGSSPNFLILHRNRVFSETEQKWIGWERKRGKIERLIAVLAGDLKNYFIDLGGASQIAGNVKYLVTLDSDTRLPPGSLRDLVGVAAHPLNRPKLDPKGLNIFTGYGILQPRISTTLPAPKQFTLFHWLFAGHCGIDPYSAASSEVYQDMFAEGTFTGKGLLNVDAMHAVLSNRLPDGRVLSHDLLEGSLARCAAVTNVAVIEDAPFHADVAASRVHRWTRGDWQLLQFLIQPARYPLHAINRWKIFDNLRRSLVAPMSFLAMVLALSGVVFSPWDVLILIATAFTAGPMIGAIADFAPSRDDVAKWYFYRRAFINLLRACFGGFWNLVQLLQQARMSLDAICRALYRLIISKRHLLQWTTAAAAQASAKVGFYDLARQHRVEPILALVLMGLVLINGTQHPKLTIVIFMLWASSPIWTWFVSRVYTNLNNIDLKPEDKVYLEEVARHTWRLFERCVGPIDNHLPLDNLQTTPHDILAHRTSPTNIGLYLLSAICARQFGWIGTQELLSRLKNTLTTLTKLERHNGHFLNWYDTQSLTGLSPKYVSTVDSGNLSGHLLAVAQACDVLAQYPYDCAAVKGAILIFRNKLDLQFEHWTEEFPALLSDCALAYLISIINPLEQCRLDTENFGQILQNAAIDVESLINFESEENHSVVAYKLTTRNEIIWQLTDYIATLRSALLDIKASKLDRDFNHHETADLLRSISQDLEQIAWQADFNFLYHSKRRLLHIGYRIAEQQLDNSFYDLLASESRLTSLLAIAKGDVPVKHWAALGRPLYAVGAHAGLRSWSGSMFEYLMPSLVLDEPRGSLLHDACCAALKEQIAFATINKTPWGISESAYAASDSTLAYQYAPQGVPRLALRRTPPGELVVSPYSTALAAQIDRHHSVNNFKRLQALNARSRYGFIEALDYSSARQSNADIFSPVDTFMAHHQGMSIVAIANVLLERGPRHWSMLNPRIDAMSSLLQERVPREVLNLQLPSKDLTPQVLKIRTPGLLRDVMPGTNALEPTHVLSNGRYTVALRSNGAGTSSLGQIGVTRWRDDALADAHGSFFYVSWDKQPTPVSITHHPAPDSNADYTSTFHSDRICFDTQWPELQVHTTVWVSPEDDIEFRRVELRNMSGRTIDFELISAFEITLSSALADEAHPAFGNLFVKAQWLAAEQALLFERKPRLANESAVYAAHFIAVSDSQLIGLSCQTDRQKWLGRNNTSSHPITNFEGKSNRKLNIGLDNGALDNNTLDTGLDPVCAMSARLRISPLGKARLTFATTAHHDKNILEAVIDKYRQHSHVQRSSLMSATLAGIRLRSLGLSAEKYSAIQLLTTAIVQSLSRPDKNKNFLKNSINEVCDKRLLWRFGISADRPIIFVSISAVQGLGLLRSLVQALHIWSWGGVACDLVILNSELASYEMPLQREINMLLERYKADSGAGSGNPSACLHVMRANEISLEELSTLKILARIQFQADGRPFVHHVDEWTALHAKSFEHRQLTSRSVVPIATQPDAIIATSIGEFDSRLNEFKFDVGSKTRPKKPWVNVMANPDFGTLLTETGGGYTWAGNSRLNQLTAWSNDPVSDSPAEWFLVQDTSTQAVWSVAPSAWGDTNIVYSVKHGQGYSEINHRRNDLQITVTWCVDPLNAIKQIFLKIVNLSDKTKKLRVVGIAEWMMGANRSDRSTTRTDIFRQHISSPKYTYSNIDLVNTQKITALLCTQRQSTSGFTGGTAFLATLSDTNSPEDWTCDRRECFDTRGRLVLPDHYGQNSGCGLDPCAALAVRIDIKPGEIAEQVFLLGYADSVDAAQKLATLALLQSASQRMINVRDHWDKLLGATRVKTPDPLFDAMVNRWLLYQTVSCRLWAKAGFYQAGGAYGYRDQLQDAMALTWTAPDLLRKQIILNASRQFQEGDVQHWWHAPTGAGVRTHFSDDLLWLPHACVRYLQATNDLSLLDQNVPFIEGAAVPEGVEDAYYTPVVSTQEACVYEHAARAIDKSLKVGVHGLPLMGSGDWNDGMNRVGNEGRGESVWLAWFLYQLVVNFSPVARLRGDLQRAKTWEIAAQGWKTALLNEAWDGQWFKRAFFDDGSALGSHVNSEARIDLIAQAWSVLSGAVQPALQRIALEAMEKNLIDPKFGLMKLLDPPLVDQNPSAGYIQAYPPGIRENGGQYSHGAVWALMAQAAYIGTLSEPGVQVDIPYRYFTYLSPAHRASQPDSGAVYGIEPYVMAGDVYTQPPYVGRGGWSWYTGAAAWMHRAAIESIFGLHITATNLKFMPCLPLQWPQAELILTRGDRIMRFIFYRASQAQALEATLLEKAKLLPINQILNWPELDGNNCFVIPLLKD